LKLGLRGREKGSKEEGESSVGEGDRSTKVFLGKARAD